MLKTIATIGVSFVAGSIAGGVLMLRRVALAAAQAKAKEREREEELAARLQAHGEAHVIGGGVDVPYTAPWGVTYPTNPADTVHTIPEASS